VHRGPISRLPRRWLSTTAAAVTLGLAAGLTVAAPAQATSPSATLASQSRESAEAAAITGAARSLKRDVARTLAEYEQAFGSQLPAADRATLRGLVDDADRQLAAVVRETSTLETALGASSPNRARAAKARSQAAWARAQASADASFGVARDILEPRMGILDRVAALQDYSSLMARFEDLGERIDTLSLA